MEREIHGWTERFGVCVLSLPAKFRIAIPSAHEGGDGVVEVPAVVKSSSKLQGFVALASDSKQKRARAMLLREPGEPIAEIEGMGDVSTQPLQHGAQQFILSSRDVPERIPPVSRALKKLTSEMGELAAAPSCLDPAATDIRLLKVESYFYDASRSQFLIVQAAPYEVASMMTLEELKYYDPSPHDHHRAWPTPRASARS